MSRFLVRDKKAALDDVLLVIEEQSKINKATRQLYQRKLRLRARENKVAHVLFAGIEGAGGDATEPMLYKGKVVTLALETDSTYDGKNRYSFTHETVNKV